MNFYLLLIMQAKIIVSFKKACLFNYNSPQQANDVSVVDVDDAHLAVESDFPAVGELHFIVAAVTLDRQDPGIGIVALHVALDLLRNNR